MTERTNEGAHSSGCPAVIIGGTCECSNPEPPTGDGEREGVGRRG